MRERFFRFWDRIGAKGERAQKSFVLLKGMYNEPHRFYHNLNHIKDCLDEFDIVQHISEHPHELEFAIWYHDAIYDTKAKDNEERSARLAYNTCKLGGLANNFAEIVKGFVLVTKHIAVPESVDGKLIVDVDLSSLGKPADDFDEQNRNIRREYSWVPEEDYRKGRKDILQGFLDRSSIYLTNFFRKRYGAQAIRNLERSIKQLS